MSSDVAHSSRSSRIGAGMLVGTSIAMLLLAAAFYQRSVEAVASGTTRAFIASLCLGAALPFSWILLQWGLRRRAVAALAGLTCSLLYLVAFGWFAVLLMLLSWGDLTFWLPATGLPIQLVALIAGIAAWRGLAAEAKTNASRWLGIAMPVALVALPFVASQLLRVQIEHLPEQRQAQSVSAERVVTAIQRCLVDRAGRQGTGYPSSLAELPSDGAACSSATLEMARARGSMRLEYFVAPAGHSGVRSTFMLCAAPTRVPDAGMVTVVGDDTGALRRATASDGATEAVPCARAWGGGATAIVKQLQSCLLAYADGHPQGYPLTIAELHTALPSCLGDVLRSEPDDPYRVTLQALPGEAIGVQYLADTSGAGGAVSGYQLFIQCAGQEGKAVVDERGFLLEPESPAALWWLNGCADSERSDPHLLAQREGFRLAVVRAPANPTAREAESPATSTAASAEREPQFGDRPDLAARRMECVNDALACYGLGRELERSLRIAGANPDRVEELSAEQKAVIGEANRSFARACEAGSVRACYAEAEVALDGRGMAVDPARALALFGDSCRGGLVEACSRVGELRENGHQPTRRVQTSMRRSPYGEAKPLTISAPDTSRTGIAKDLKGAIEGYQRACTLGDLGGCVRAARLTLESLESSDAERAAALGQYRDLCNRGQGFACTALAEQASAKAGSFEGVPAAEWRRRACALGERASCVP
jgi:hypothetical protein